MAAYVNQYGRKPGRGIRPWLLIPKVLGVAVYFGAVSAAAALAWLWPDGSLEETRQLANAVRFIMVFCAVPGLIVAIFAGIGLFMQHPAVFCTRRWWGVKMLLLLVGIPLLHYYTRDVVQSLRIYQNLPLHPHRVMLLRWLLTAAASMMVVIIFLGRYKPRLGQPVAAVARQKQSKETA